MAREMGPLVQRTEARENGHRLQLALESLESGLEIERLSAIYSLELLARDNDLLRAEAALLPFSGARCESFGTELLGEVLTALIRRHARPASIKSGRVSSEIQAALTVLARTQIKGSTPLDLHGISLREAYLPLAKLSGAFLYECDFEGALFCNADLRGAWLWRSNLTRVNFDGANLCGADLTGALGATRAQFSEAIFDKETRWPLFER